MTLIILGTVLPWLLVLAGFWLGLQVVRQNGRILLRLEALEKQLARLGHAGGGERAPRPSLPLGSPAPEFELPDLAGARGSLAQFRGRKVLLIFFNPRCGFCRKMVPRLVALPPEGGEGRPVPLVVTTGSVDDNRKLMDEHGVRCPVLLQEKTEVATKYQAQGTPVGYLIDEEGKIASPIAIGADPLLALVDKPETAANHPVEANGHVNKVQGKTNRGLHTSRLLRDGLKAGTPAPDFRLPLLDGGELSREDYRGRRVLLVFSDPDCDPCDRIAPELERFHRGQQDIQVIMIGRRDPAANGRKVQEQGLTFPVALQRAWEISRLYGMFSTPIAYLIDERGVIAEEVTKGVEDIQRLMATTVSANGVLRAATAGKEASVT